MSGRIFHFKHSARYCTALVFVFMVCMTFIEHVADHMVRSLRHAFTQIKTSALRRPEKYRNVLPREIKRTHQPY